MLWLYACLLTQSFTLFRYDNMQLVHLTTHTDQYTHNRALKTSPIPTMIATPSSKFRQIPEAVCTVLTPDDWWRFHPKHVEHY
jgi:hypothetical protein